MKLTVFATLLATAAAFSIKPEKLDFGKVRTTISVIVSDEHPGRVESTVSRETRHEFTRASVYFLKLHTCCTYTLAFADI